jgi:hypothetical protein
MSKSRLRLPHHGAAAVSTTRSRISRITARLTIAAIVAAGSALGAAATSSTASAASALVVDANQPYRTVTHVASGALYGLDTASVPADSLVEPLHPNTFVQMAPGGKQLPNGETAPGGDALVVAPEAAKAGAKVVVRMPDWYPNFPYVWVSWSNWLSAVDTQVKAVLASGDSNISAFELWNEPDWTWNTAAAGSFDAGWARTFDEVRQRLPPAHDPRQQLRAVRQLHDQEREQRAQAGHQRQGHRAGHAGRPGDRGQQHNPGLDPGP